MNISLKKQGRWTCILLMASCISLTGCAAKTKTLAQNDIGSACNDNVYLQKFHCSIEEVQQAALAGNPDAQYALGYMYYYGIGTVRDQQTATLWIQRAASAGQTLAIKASKLIAADSHAKPTTTASTTPAPSHVSQKEFKVTPATAQYKTAHPKALAQNSNSSLLNKNSQHFTLQLLGSYDEATIKQFINNNNLASVAQYYESSHNNKPWYRLVYGDYNSHQSAVAAIAELPQNLQQLKPWAKSFASVQSELSTTTMK